MCVCVRVCKQQRQLNLLTGRLLGLMGIDGVGRERERGRGRVRPIDTCHTNTHEMQRQSHLSRAGNDDGVAGDGGTIR